MTNELSDQVFDLKQKTEENREVANQLLIKYRKTLVNVASKHINSIWKDFERDMKRAVELKILSPHTMELNMFCNENYQELWKVYPFDISHWYKNWYEIYLEVKDLRITVDKLSYQYWWSLFIQIEHPQTFYGFITSLSKVQQKHEREALRKFYWEDLEWREKIVKMDLPATNFEIINPINLYSYIKRKQERESLKILKRQVRQNGKINDISACEPKYKKRRVKFKLDDVVEHEEEGPGIVVKNDFGPNGEIITVCFHSGLMTAMSAEELTKCNQQKNKKLSLAR